MDGAAGMIPRTTSQASMVARIKASDRLKQQRSDRRKAVHYEANAPRCENCASFRKAGTVLINSAPVERQAKCAQHKFGVSPNGCCDTWIGHNGVGLAP